MTTNGSLVSRIEGNTGKDNIIKNNLKDIDVSLDYSDEKMHNLFRGNEKAFQMANETLAYCSDSDINTTIVVMGMDSTLDVKNMSGIFDIANQYNALVRVNIYRPVNKDNGLKSPKFDTLIKLFDWAYNNHYISSLSDPLFSSILSKDFHKDPSGSNSLRILPDGTIYPSTYLISPNYKLGHIDEKNALLKTQDNPILKSLLNIVPDECQDCNVVRNCSGGTIDRRVLWYGTLNKPDPYCPKKFGHDTNLRMYKLNKENFSSIHDGYLPTIFFKPKLEVKNE